MEAQILDELETWLELQISRAYYDEEAYAKAKKYSLAAQRADFRAAHTRTLEHLLSMRRLAKGLGDES